MNRKFMIVPSKRGKLPSHCSSMMRRVKKVKELTQLFSSLEECTISLHRFVVAVWKLIKLLIKIIWWLLFLISILSAL